jgi:hypothetical protein
LLVFASLASTVTAFSPCDAHPRHGVPLKTGPPQNVEPEIYTGPMPGYSRKAPSSTARESAVLAEFERRSELERRIQDGFTYDHFPEMSDSYVNSNQSTGSRFHHDDAPSARGVFCGMRTTQEDYNRLRSANANQA